MNRMKRRILLATLALTLGACASNAPVQSASGSLPTPTTTPVEPLHVQLDLVDASRPAEDPFDERSAPQRDLPTELYLPATAPAPLIVFAHGYGGDPSKFTDLFTHWSDAGFAVAAPRFPVTYTGASGATLARSGDYLQQPADLTFILDAVLASEYGDRIDADRIGAAGLSLGGVTTWGWVTNTCCRDERPRAAMIMDGNRFDFADGRYVPNRIPVIVFHADEDPALPYANAEQSYRDAVAPKYFVTIEAFTHAEPFENTPAPSDEMVMRTSIDFWRAYLLDDVAARQQIVSDATVEGVSHAEAQPR